MINWEWIDSPDHVAIFVQLLLRANYKTTKYRGTEIRRGQVVSGRKKLQEWTGIEENKAYRLLKALQATGEIDIKSNNRFSIVTIRNYEAYQGKNILSRQQNDNRATTKRQQMNTSNNLNNLNKQESLSGKPDVVGQVVEFLNLKAGKKFKKTTPGTRSHIQARVNEGFTLDDFKSVIEKKVSEWGGTEMEKFLRPQTLFGPKFESYLNQGPVKSYQQEVDEKKIEVLKGELIDYESGDIEGTHL
jgi:uncharacterized phage protein (TIGR02220 family)